MRSACRKSTTAVPSRKKLRIGSDVEQLPGHAVALDHAPDPFVGVNRDRAFLDDHLIFVNRPGNLAGNGVDIGQVGAAGAALRCAHSDKDGLRGLGCRAQIAGEFDGMIPMPAEQLGKIILVDRDAAVREGPQFRFVVVDADHAVPDLGETRGGHQTHVSGPDDGDGNTLAHGFL